MSFIIYGQWQPILPEEALIRFLPIWAVLYSCINLAYMWFIGVNPEDDLPDPSLLAKFRTQRLKDTSLDDIIKEVVRQCIEKGIVKGTGISVDCTHTAANTVKKVPERICRTPLRKC